MANRGVNLDPHILTIRDLEAAANKKLTKPIRGRIHPLVRPMFTVDGADGS